MAREAGFETMFRKGKIHGFDRDGDYTEELKAFEALVRADEREACAKVCEAGVNYEHPTVKGHIMENFGHSRLLANAIRARGNT